MEELSLDMTGLGQFLLKRDILYNKISSRERNGLIEFAIESGEEAGLKVLADGIDKDKPCAYIEKYCKINFLRHKAPLPIYSECLLKDGTINIYCSEIDDLYLKLNEEGYMVDRNRLYNIFLLHEFFHVLEERESGSVSSMRKIKVFKFLFWEIKRGISQLSEIAANSFLRTIIGGLPIKYICKEDL